MFSKRNPMKYFSGNAFARLPLYKLVAGGSAVVLTASIGLGVMAASFTPQAQPEPTPEPPAIVEAPPPPGPRRRFGLFSPWATLGGSARLPG